MTVATSMGQSALVTSMTGRCGWIITLTTIMHKAQSHSTGSSGVDVHGSESNILDGAPGSGAAQVTGTALGSGSVHPRYARSVVLAWIMGGLPGILRFHGPMRTGRGMPTTSTTITDRLHALRRCHC